MTCNFCTNKSLEIQKVIDESLANYLESLNQKVPIQSIVAALVNLATKICVANAPNDVEAVQLLYGLLHASIEECARGE